MLTSKSHNVISQNYYIDINYLLVLYTDNGWTRWTIELYREKNNLYYYNILQIKIYIFIFYINWKVF